VVPIERLCEGGSLGRRVRIWEVVGDDGFGKMYWTC
jgi:hypothetical protein